MTNDWHLQTNIKNKPNAQGTLFSGGKSQMNPAKRYPRGYTPDRQKAILDAMGGGVVDHVTSELDLPDGDSSRGYHARETYEHLKQSSIPPEHLHNLHIAVVDKHDEYGEMAHHLDDETEGTYNHMKYRGPDGKPVIRGDVVVSHEASPYTVLHEVGHHVSQTKGTPHAAYRSPLEKGKEEGFADRYADTHMTPTLNNGFYRNSVQGRANYPPSPDQHLGREEEFDLGYDIARPYRLRLPSRQDLANDRRNAKVQHERRTPTLPGMETPK